MACHHILDVCFHFVTKHEKLQTQSSYVITKSLSQPSPKYHKKNEQLRLWYKVVYDRRNVISIGSVSVNSKFLTRQKCVNKQWDYGWGDLLG